MKSHIFTQLPCQIVVNGNFDETCEMTFSQQALDAIERGTLKVRISTHGWQSKISGFRVRLGNVAGQVNIFVGRDDANVILGEGCSGNYNLKLWGNSTISIGKNTTSNHCNIICSNSAFVWGEDCMFSDGVLVQTADQHGIVDITSGLIINDQHKSVVLGDHVWLGRQCILTANAQVGKGSIIGTGAIVTGRIPEMAIAAGTPARVIKENHTWCRALYTLDEFSQRYIDERG